MIAIKKLFSMLGNKRFLGYIKKHSRKQRPALMADTYCDQICCKARIRQRCIAINRETMRKQIHNTTH